MTPPLFSIVLPTYNCAAKLDATIQSVLAQQKGIYELLVMDGGSTDGTVALLKQYGDVLRWHSAPDKGIYDAMNQGVLAGSGQFLYFLGAGDLLKPGVLALLAQTLPPPYGAFVYGDVERNRSPQMRDGAFSRCKLTRGNICHQAIFYSRDVFQTLGLYDIQYRVMADYVLNMKCFGSRLVAKTYVPLTIAEYEGGGTSTLNDDTNFYRDQPRLIKTYLGTGAYLVFLLERLLPPAFKAARFRFMQTLKRLLRHAP